MSVSFWGPVSLILNAFFPPIYIFVDKRSCSTLVWLMWPVYLELFNSRKKVKTNGLMGHKGETELNYIKEFTSSWHTTFTYVTFDAASAHKTCQ